MGMVRLVVDGANVVGSVPDGWWRDRAAAAVRLRDALARVATGGLPGLPPPLEVVLVVEGAARGVDSGPGVRVVPAPGAGDDTVVRLVREAGDRRCVVVTADRELRERVRAAGAEVRGPRDIPRLPPDPDRRRSPRDRGSTPYHEMRPSPGTRKRLPEAPEQPPEPTT